jgi:hypothetical protein
MDPGCKLLLPARISAEELIPDQVASQKANRPTDRRSNACIASRRPDDRTKRRAAATPNQRPLLSRRKSSTAGEGQGHHKQKNNCTRFHRVPPISSIESRAVFSSGAFRLARRVPASVSPWHIQPQVIAVRQILTPG